jgi:ArsR family transcriptional regulator
MSNIREEQITEYAEKFKALSNPNRLKIFLRLVSECCVSISEDELEGDVESQGCACVGDIGKFLGIVPSTISHHLKELRQAGLISMERRGQKMECWIDPKTVKAMGAFFSLGE